MLFWINVCHQAWLHIFYRFWQPCSIYWPIYNPIVKEWFWIRRNVMIDQFSYIFARLIYSMYGTVDKPNNYICWISLKSENLFSQLYLLCRFRHVEELEQNNFLQSITLTILIIPCHWFVNLISPYGPIITSLVWMFRFWVEINY